MVSSSPSFPRKGTETPHASLRGTTDYFCSSPSFPRKGTETFEPLFYHLQIVLLQNVLVHPFPARGRKQGDVRRTTVVILERRSSPSFPRKGTETFQGVLNAEHQIGQQVLVHPFPARGRKRGFSLLNCSTDNTVLVHPFPARGRMRLSVAHKSEYLRNTPG